MSPLRAVLTGGSTGLVVALLATMAVLLGGGVASAASLGGLQAAGLAAFGDDATRCDTQVTYALVTSGGNVTSVTVGDVAGACAGLTVQLVLVRADGTALTSATGTAAAGSFSLTPSPAATASQVTGARATFAGLQIPIVAAAGPTVTSTVTITSDSDTSYCANVTVTTTSTTPVTWTSVVDLSTWPVNGVPSQMWNATYTMSGTTMTAKGMSFNATVVAGSPVTYGYCANRPPPPPGIGDYSLTITNDWGAGYCAVVTVSTTSVSPITWTVLVDMSTAPVNGTPYTVSNATWSLSNHVMTASGAGWNSVVRAGHPTQFNYCANR